MGRADLTLLREPVQLPVDSAKQLAFSSRLALRPLSFLSTINRPRAPSPARLPEVPLTPSPGSFPSPLSKTRSAMLSPALRAVRPRSAAAVAGLRAISTTAARPKSVHRPLIWEDGKYELPTIAKGAIKGTASMAGSTEECVFPLSLLPSLARETGPKERRASESQRGALSSLHPSPACPLPVRRSATRNAC